jgi:SAM-dependent methyltransferase
VAFGSIITVVVRDSQSKDAYGHLLWDFLKGREPLEIVERDDGLISVDYGPRVYFSNYKTWIPIEKIAMKYVRGTVLDIGCGAGRHSLYLQKKGFDVIGIDSSPLAIAVCKSRGLRKARVLSIANVGVFAPSTFDSVILMGNNFGLFGSFHRAQVLLKQLHRITTPSAKIVAATTDPYATEDPLHHAYRRWNMRRGRMAGQVRLRIRHRNLISAWMDYLLVSKKELGEILVGTGWSVYKFHNSRKASHARYLMVLRKV